MEEVAEKSTIMQTSGQIIAYLRFNTAARGSKNEYSPRAARTNNRTGQQYRRPGSDRKYCGQQEKKQKEQEYG